MRTLFIALITCLFVLPAHAKYSGGTGEPNDPYQIATAADLIALGETPEDYDKHFILTADIDLDPNLPGRKVFDKAVIAPDTNDTEYWFQGTPFAGVFDGRGHTISHLTITGESYLGLFGILGQAEVENLGVVDARIVGSGGYVGGLVGYKFCGIVTKCFSTGRVSGNSDVGGLVGVNSWTIYQGGCDPVVTHCYSTAAVSGGDNVGGLVGTNGRGYVRQCYSSGAVMGTGKKVGGLVGYTYNYFHGGVDVAASFWDIQTSGQATSDGGTGLTTAEMQTASTFMEAGWDFVGETVNGTDDIWKISEGLGYPRLAWEKYSGGTGEPNDPYQIATAADLIALGDSPEDYDKHFVLTADIDLDPNLPGQKVFDKAVIAPDTNDVTWWFEGPSFTGVFDGKGHTISHLTITGGSYLGLFGQLETGRWRGPAGLVKNLGVVDVSVTGTGDYVGGLAGYNSGGTVTLCYSSGVVSGNSYVGGLVGMESEPSFWGGRTIMDCYSTAAVSATTGNAGGLVGYNDYGTIVRCYSTGPVAAASGAGGLVGESGEYSGTVADCFWDIQTSGWTSSAGGVGLATAEMMDPQVLALNGWANDPNWVLDTGRDYPRLAWEGTPGGIIPEANMDWLTGQGTADSPYRIDTADQLILLVNASILWNRHFVIGADIDLDPNLPGRKVFDSAVIAPAGTTAFTGVFDGKGHTISHLTITGGSYLGLFGQLGSGAELKDLGIVDVNIIGSDSGYRVGGLVGRNYGSVTQCYSTGVVSGNSRVGGLVGGNANGGVVTQCYSIDMVAGSEYVGGLVGGNDGSVTQCYSNSAVNATGWGVGGLVGAHTGTVTNCYSTGAVTGFEYVGGLVGGSSGRIANSYSTGLVSGSWDVAGLVGQNYNGDVTNCFWDIQTSGQTTSDAGTGKTTAEMQTASTFLEAGWDFVGETANGTEDIWWILEGQDYPRLWWETPN